jgi:hypothetical protein
MAADMTNEFERIAYEDLSPEETWTRLGKGASASRRVAL